MKIKCIDQRVCESCPELEIDINKLTLHNNDQVFGTVNDIYCKHYEKCSRLLRYLLENKDDIKYIGRDGD